MTTSVLAVRDLDVSVARGPRRLLAVDDVGFEVPEGGSLGIVGESGSGKSLTLRALMALLPPAARAERGVLELGGQPLPLSGADARKARRRRLAMVFQDPLSGLDPVKNVGVQVAEVPRRVLGESRTASWRRTIELLGLVGLPDPERNSRSFPHQLSGGMRQRVVIAMALATEPKVLLCDEPTTALDVTVQAQVLDLLAGLRSRLGLAIVFVSHDLAVVRQVCDQLAVMYAGKFVETGPRQRCSSVLHIPTPLVSSRLSSTSTSRTSPPGRSPGMPPDLAHLPPGCPFAPRCRFETVDCTMVRPALSPFKSDGSPRATRCIHPERLEPGRIGAWAVGAWAGLGGAGVNLELGSPAEHQRDGLLSPERAATDAGHIPAEVLLAADQLHVSFPSGGGQRVTAVEDVSFSVAAGETLGIVGESGCGKTTVARCLAGLLRPDSGTVSLRGSPLSTRRTRQEHRAIQLVFQDPYSSLNPRLSVRSVLRELLVANGLARGEGLERRCRELMSLVGLPIGALDGYPSSFSGGQRQRIAIARALAVEPQVIVADEPISALDVSVQAAVLALFTELRDELGIGIVLISHNLAAVRQVCDRVAVMYLGRVVEIGRRDDIFDDPRHPYTKALLAAAPRLRARGQGRARALKESPRARRPGPAVARSIPAAQGPSRYAATFCPRCYLPPPGATG